AWMRRALLRGRSVALAPTWDCGYLRPSARMEYSASSFAQPLTDLFAGVLDTRVHAPKLEGLFPPVEEFETHTPDAFQERFYLPAYRWIRAAFTRLRWIQDGRMHLYILYILACLVALLGWVSLYG
ncbi:MAG: hydrogenase, partial [Candidatus Eremiobacterota bacterium]